MNLLFHSTETFEQDLQEFDSCVQKKIVERVNEVSQKFIQDRRVFARLARKPYPFQLSNGFESSLYSIVVVPNLRVILTADEDPLFDQAIITLLRVVKRPDLQKAYTSVAQSLYQTLNGNHAQQGVPVRQNPVPKKI